MSRAGEKISQHESGRPLPALEVEVHTEGHQPPELRLRGEIDIVTVPVLDESLSALVDGAGTSDVVVDLANVDFMGVAGLEALCNQARRMNQRGQRLVVSSPSTLTRRVIDILGVGDLLSLPAQEPPPRDAP